MKKFLFININFINLIILKNWGLGLGVLGLGVVGLGVGPPPPTPKPQSPIPNPQIINYFKIINYLMNKIYYL